MRTFILSGALALLASPAFAGRPVEVPEMSAGAGLAAVALLVGVAAIIRERTKRK